ncbi:hypothetical protein JCM10207_000269 [Rhodosporidiobolus poonsookiae]
MASASPEASTSRLAGDIFVERGGSGEAQETVEQPSKRKRSRITQACRRCKSRRARCDGAAPVCGECAKAGAVCEMPDPAEDGRKRRKSRAPSGLAKAAPAAVDPPLPAGSAQASAAPLTGPSDSPATLPPPPADLLSDSTFSSSFELPDASAIAAPTAFDLFASFAAAQADTAYPAPVTGSSTATSAPAGAAVDDASSTPVPQLSYLRPFGPTGIHPGLEQIVISIAAPPAFSRDQSPTLPPSFPTDAFPFSFDSSALSPSTFNQHGSQIPAFSSTPATRVERFFEDGSDLPREEIKAELLDVFFRRLGSHFPFLDRRAIDRLNNRDLSTGVDAPLLINSICAVAARFSTSEAVKGPDASRAPGLYGVPFADKAKSMLIPLLGYPSTRTVQSLLLLSWHEFGLNNDGSFWSMSGMAMRMAQDLGLHLSIDHPRIDLYTQAVNRLTWWAVVAHDRMLSLGTGRPVTIKSYEISTPPPCEDDISLVSGRTADLPSAFPAYCQLMLLLGDMCDSVNNVKGKWKAAMPPTPLYPGQPGDEAPNDACPPPHQAAHVHSLEPLEDAITGAYASLPPPLRWSSLNFRKQHEAGLGPVFLHLHLWYNCILIMLYGPPLLYPRTKAASMSLPDRLAVSTRSSLAISQIIGVAELNDENDYEAAPFVNQTFFVCCSSWIKDHHIRTGRSVLESSSRNYDATDLLAQSASENFALCRNALARQEAYWLGAGWLGALAGRKGAQASRTSIKTATAGLSTFVSEAEMAVFRRLAKRIGGEAHTPDLNFDNDALTAFFNTLQSDTFAMANQNQELSPDDLALAYTFASTFQDVAQAPQPQL